MKQIRVFSGRRAYLCFVTVLDRKRPRRPDASPRRPPSSILFLRDARCKRVGSCCYEGATDYQLNTKGDFTIPSWLRLFFHDDIDRAFPLWWNTGNVPKPPARSPDCTLSDLGQVFQLPLNVNEQLILFFFCLNTSN